MPASGNAAWATGDVITAVKLNNIETALAASVAKTGDQVTGELTVLDLKVSGLTGATAASRYVGATTSGAPATGTFAVGDLVIDQTGAVWICTVAGTPGTWVRMVKQSGDTMTGNLTAPTLIGNVAAGTTPVQLPNHATNPSDAVYGIAMVGGKLKINANGTVTDAGVPENKVLAYSLIF